MRFEKTIGGLCFTIARAAAAAAAAGIFSSGGPGPYSHESVRGRSVEVYGRGIYRHMSAEVAPQGIGHDYVTLFIAAPLLILASKRARRGSAAGRFLLSGTLMYFAALGVGYMFVEIILIQRFILYFGQPVFAISAVISTMLIASGAGSLLSEKLKARPQTLFLIGTIITLMLVFYAFTLTPVLQESISKTLEWKILISLFMIGIPSFFKGMMFPLGIRFLSAYDSSQIPWAWGINGSVSVISTSLATIIAVESGFRTVIFMAVGCYLLATLVFVLYRWSFSRDL